MEQSELLTDARQIASHVVNGDLNVAKDMFDRKLTGLKHYEAVILRDKIQEFVKECEAKK